MKRVPTVCAWCLTALQTTSERIKKGPVYCCKQCQQADAMFNLWQSDEEIMRRRKIYEEGKNHAT